MKRNGFLVMAPDHIDHYINFNKIRRKKYRLYDLNQFERSQVRFVLHVYISCPEYI